MLSHCRVVKLQKVELEKGRYISPFYCCWAIPFMLTDCRILILIMLYVLSVSPFDLLPLAGSPLRMRLIQKVVFCYSYSPLRTRTHQSIILEKAVEKFRWFCYQSFPVTASQFAVNLGRKCQYTVFSNLGPLACKYILCNLISLFQT